MGAAGVVAHVVRRRRGRRQRFSGAPRLCACLRQYSRHRQVRRRRLAGMGHVRSDRMDRQTAMVRRQCRHDRHFRVRRRAVRGGRAAAVVAQGDLPLRLDGRLRPVGLSRFLSGRRHPHDGVPARWRRRVSRQSRAAGPAHRRSRQALARGHEQSRPDDVSEHLQHHRGKGPDHAAGLRYRAQSLRPRRHRGKDQGEDVADQDSLLHGLRLVRLHIQAAPARKPAVVSGSAGRAKEASHQRTGASGTAIPPATAGSSPTRSCRCRPRRPTRLRDCAS